MAARSRVIKISCTDQYVGYHSLRKMVALLSSQKSYTLANHAKKQVSKTLMNAVNWIGLWTLYHREVWRFTKVFNQTIIAPVVTTLLFLAIFTLALGRNHHAVEGIPFDQFIAPGLIMMAIVQNAFANVSSSLMLSKIQGVIIDLLMPPISAGELTFALMMGGITRGVMVGIVVASAMSLFVPFQVHAPWLAVFYAVSASMMLALIGVLAGIWAQSFDQMSAITNYVVTPLAFLSGTFYSVKNLPDIWYAASQFNPFFYMIDGIRYALTGHTDTEVSIGIMVMVGVNAILWVIARRLVARSSMERLLMTGA